MPATLFTPINFSTPDGHGLTLRNRAFIAPMCQYAIDAEDGVPTDWQLQHLGAFAAGGFGLVMTEATGVEARGRISPRDLGLYTDEQETAHARVVRFIHSQGAVAGVQLGHAGGKASTYPWLPGEQDGTVPPSQGGWATVGMTSRPVMPNLDAPAELDEAGLAGIVQSFVDAARRADAAGYDVVQIHAAHGYLLHQAYSPLTKPRQDGYGGDEEGRTRLVREVVDAVRAVWPASKPLAVRLSATDWAPDGWDIEASVRLVRSLIAEHGVSWVDASSGGLGTGPIPVGPGYQVWLAARLKQELADTDAVISTVGLITEAAQAETILRSGQADAVSIGRAALRDPHWAARAAATLGVPELDNPRAPQFWRAGW